MIPKQKNNVMMDVDAKYNKKACNYKTVHGILVSLFEVTSPFV